MFGRKSVGYAYLMIGNNLGPDRVVSREFRSMIQELLLMACLKHERSGTACPHSLGPTELAIMTPLVNHRSKLLLIVLRARIGGLVKDTPIVRLLLGNHFQGFYNTNNRVVLLADVDSK